MFKKLILFNLILFQIAMFAQTNPLNQLNFLIGNWEGKGVGFGNNTSVIQSSFQPEINGNFIAVTNESQFESTEKNPEGENHIDKGYISYDNSRKLIVFRQFNIEGFVNQYVFKFKSFKRFAFCF